MNTYWSSVPSNPPNLLRSTRNTTIERGKDNNVRQTLELELDQGTDPSAGTVASWDTPPKNVAEGKGSKVHTMKVPGRILGILDLHNEGNSLSHLPQQISIPASGYWTPPVSATSALKLPILWI